MIVEPTVEKITITCEKCGCKSFINWDQVDNSEKAYCDCYGEIYCPICGSKGAVYTRNKIEDIKRGTVDDI